jgi:hypothetical protein
MVPLERQLAEIEATVRSLMGDREGSRRIAQELVGVLEETGAHRYADFVRHAFLEETSAAS